MKNYRYNNPNMLKMNLMIIRQVRQQLSDKEKWESVEMCRNVDWVPTEIADVVRMKKH